MAVTTVEIPFEIDTVDPTSANAYWTTVNRLWYESVYRFGRTGNPGPIAGRGLMTFRANIPKNLASPANWNIVLHHTQASGDASNNLAGAAVLVRVDAKANVSGDTLAAMTTIVPNLVLGVRPSGDLTVSVLSSSSFDSLVSLTASGKLCIQVSRMPHSASGDSAAGHWDLMLPPLLRCDVS